MPNKANHAAFADLRLIHSAWSAVSRVFDRALEPTGLSLPQALALMAIAEAKPPLLMSRLGKLLHQQPQSMTTLVDRLERSGLAHRVTGVLHDRRAITIELTEEGHNKFPEIQKVFSTTAADIANVYGNTFSADIRAMCDTVYAACQKSYPELHLPDQDLMQ